MFFIQVTKIVKHHKFGEEYCEDGWHMLWLSDEDAGDAGLYYWKHAVMHYWIVLADCRYD